MGFSTEKQFELFQHKCRQVALNIRKNQYFQVLSKDKERLSQLISSLRDSIGDSGKLKYPDKYGHEAKEIEDS